MTDNLRDLSGCADRTSGQSDLRDRIAAVLIEAAEFRGVYQLHNPDMRFLADAVIAALGLRPERGQRSNPDGPLWGSNNRHNVTRYVTEWAPDE